MCPRNAVMAETLSRHSFTRDDYHRMVEAGILTEDDPVELLHGEIVVMAPIGSRHAECVRRCHSAFAKLEDRAITSVQCPVTLEGANEPEPDLALLAPRAGGYPDRHPGPSDILLVIEVAETSHLVDREVKAPLYASSGIPEYWLIDLAENRIEVHRGPDDGCYRHVHSVGPGELLHPLAFPDFAVVVDQITP